MKLLDCIITLVSHMRIICAFTVKEPQQPFRGSQDLVEYMSTWYFQTWVQLSYVIFFFLYNDVDNDKVIFAVEASMGLFTNK